MALLSYPRSANKYSAVSPSIREIGLMQFCVVPCVIIALTGIPCASTAKCSFVLSPLLCGSYLDFRLLRHSHEGEPYNGLHQSLAIHSQGYQSNFPKAAPKHLYLANG